MKQRNKLTILSILTSAVIMTSSMSMSTGDKRFISSYYDVLLDSVVDDVDFSLDNINFMPEDSYVPQGISIMSDYVLVSSYDYYKNKNSIICVYDKDGNLVNNCLLDINAHVGGIAYDSNNNLIWVTSYEGKVNAYLADDIVSKDEVEPIYKDILVGKGLANYQYPWINTASFVTIYDNVLYVGNFTLSSYGRVKKYKIHLDDELVMEYLGSFRIPNKVQGLSFYKKNDKQYMLLSRSYGKEAASALQIFNYSEEIIDYTSDDVLSVSLNLSPMLEQIVCNGDETYLLFESNAKPYKFFQNKDFDSVKVIDTPELVKKLELKIDTN